MRKIVLVAVIIMAVITVFLHVLVVNTAASTSESAYGTASWYGFCSPGILKTTANMETFDENELTCATWHYPFNTYLKVTNLENGRSVVVRVNDRGPAERLVKEGRIIDLSKKAFSKIADLNKGLIRAKVGEIASPACGGPAMTGKRP